MTKTIIKTCPELSKSIAIVTGVDVGFCDCARVADGLDETLQNP
jgi:hypothetical protein